MNATAGRLAPYLTGELRSIRRRTGGGLGGSVVAHALLLLLLKLAVHEAPPVEGLVEVAWIERPAPAPAPMVSAARTTESSAEGRPDEAKPSPSPRRERFTRAMPRAETAPQPQRDASRDAVRERIAALTRSASDPRTQIAALVPRAEPARPALAGVPDAQKPGVARSLHREDARSSPDPAVLVRASAVSAPSMALASLADDPVARPAAAQAAPGSFPPREVLAGVSLAGPIADRKLLAYRLPEYPERAKREAMEASVRLRFTVRRDGGVREDVVVERTSGHEDFDHNAILALRQWRFEALSGAGDQWGTITFDYRLDSIR